jgi:hypothetical protein
VHLVDPSPTSAIDHTSFALGSVSKSIDTVRSVGRTSAGASVGLAKWTSDPRCVLSPSIAMPARTPASIR